ncbi:hypothetical protein QF032_004970 [Streptomyces achromogenes]|uniref:hypothetical protein n=1 Tax=Streptomyces achromogenes TaxID=67255 RepID=UPI00278187A2|nr:hypothetical protein [Streptomyces achromogenes]MDQ0833126.1 hypothetical protein [Streptomyces achromogenes]
MTVSIIHALLRWILGVCAPGTGRRRAGARPTATAAASARIPANPCCPGAARLPAPRSPYGLAEPLDGAATVPVRPYLLAAEGAHADRERERARQSRRRVALVMAADFGIDLDRHVVGAERAA